MYQFVILINNTKIAKWSIIGGKIIWFLRNDEIALEARTYLTNLVPMADEVVKTIISV